MDLTPLAALQAAHAVATPVSEVTTGLKQVSFWEDVVPHFGLDASFNYALADQARHVAAYRQQIEEDARNARFHNRALALLPTLFECAQCLQEAVATLQYLAPERFDDEAHEARWQAHVVHLGAPLAKLEVSA